MSFGKNLCTVAALCFIPLAGTYAADSGYVPSPAAVAYTNELDAALNDNDYAKVLDKTNRPGTIDNLNAASEWARKKMLAGGSIIYPLISATNMWKVGAAVPAGNKLAANKDTAVAIVMYALAIDYVDGVKCADLTAPKLGIDRIISQYTPALRYIATLQQDKQKEVVESGLYLEHMTASMRGNDDYLCRFGVQNSVNYYRNHWQEILEATAAGSGRIKTPQDIPDDPSYRPEYVPAETSAPIQAKMRQQLPAFLSRVVALTAKLPASK